MVKVRQSPELWFTLLYSETRKRISSSSWLLAAAGSRDGAQSGGSGGREVVAPGAHTDLRASSLIGFHRDGFCKENTKRHRGWKGNFYIITVEPLCCCLKGSAAWFNGSMTGQRLLMSETVVDSISLLTSRLATIQVISTLLPAAPLLMPPYPKELSNIENQHCRSNFLWITVHQKWGFFLYYKSFKKLQICITVPSNQTKVPSSTSSTLKCCSVTIKNNNWGAYFN